MRSIVCIVVALFPIALGAQSAHKHLRAGDLFYDQREFNVAEEAYRKANAEDESAQGTFNLGNAIYQQERFDEAVTQYERAAEQASDPKVKAGAYYNLGNTYMQAQQFDKGVEAYINALKADPDDIDTKKNLTLALQQLQQQQQQQQQEQQEQEHGQDEQQDQEQEQQPQQGQDNAPQEDQSPQPDQQEQQNLSREEAEQLLRVVDRDDQKVQEKLRKASGKQRKPKKDW